MNVLFWGTRGSLPFAVTSEMIKNKIKAAIEFANGKQFSTSEDIDIFIEKKLPFSIRGGYGCNTACVEIKGGSEYVICDAGTGLRDFGNHVLKSRAENKNKSPLIINIFLSHLHWDHIQGFPFFAPAFIPGSIINIFGFHKGIKKTFKMQQAAPCFPVPLEVMPADINFTTLDINKEYRIAGFTIKGIKQNHPGNSYGYRFEKNNIKAIYATDSEHTKSSEQDDYKFIDFCRRADLLIMDAQYSFLDASYTKENWGHSSNIVVTELAARSRVKQLCMFHHEPACDDNALEQFLKATRHYLKIYDNSSSLVIDMAYDGMEVSLKTHGMENDRKTGANLLITSRQQNDRIIVKLNGKLNAVTVPNLEKRLDQILISEKYTGTKVIILNMKSLEYISSAGLRAVLLCKKKAGKENKQILICELHDIVKDVFNIAGFSSLVDINLSLQDALKI